MGLQDRRGVCKGREVRRSPVHPSTRQGHLWAHIRLLRAVPFWGSENTRDGASTVSQAAHTPAQLSQGGKGLIFSLTSLLSAFIHNFSAPQHSPPGSTPCSLSHRCWGLFVGTARAQPGWATAVSQHLLTGQVLQTSEDPVGPLQNSPPNWMQYSGHTLLRWGV